MKKLSIDYVKKQYKNKGYELLEDTWEGNDKPMLITKDGYYFIQSYANFQQGKKPILFGFQNPYAEQNIAIYIKTHFKEQTEIVQIKRIRKKQRNRLIEIDTIDNIIDNIYIEEDITYKAVNIPIEEKIYTDSTELSAYLLYGDKFEEKIHEVK
mgnify:CR=1 FL=1